MAHISLYRRFRPERFDRLVRQEHVVRILTNQIESGSVGHAYLFAGPRGTGKTSVARIFARAVNCEHPVNGSPCGECPVCRALGEGSLDISEIDAASNNGVNEMRDLREKVQYPPVSGKYKVYIVDEAHMLTDSAFNALLKTLEEPPAHAIFILATTEPHKIPATILSRCMRLDFKLIPEEDLEAHLRSILDEIGKPYEEEAVAAIARAGAGSDRDMLSIAEMCVAYSDKLTYEAVTATLGAADFAETGELCEAMLLSDGGGALSRAEKILNEGKSVGVLLRDVMTFLNQVAVAKNCRGAEKLLHLPSSLYERVKAVAEKADGRAVLRATEIFARTETELRFSSSPRIGFETAVLRTAFPCTDADLDALNARVADLERKLARLSLAAPVSSPAPEAVPAREAAPVSVPAASDHGGEFPEEEPIFEEAYFSDGPIPEQETAPKAEPAPKVAPAPIAAPAAATASAQTAFGLFLRTLRKTSRNGVLFTMCSDLEAAYEGELLALYTDIETVYRSLNREEHRKLMAEAFAQIGVAQFEVRYRGPASPKKGLEELKKNFKDYPIEVK